MKVLRNIGITILILLAAFFVISIAALGPSREHPAAVFICGAGVVACIWGIVALAKANRRAKMRNSQLRNGLMGEAIVPAFDTGIANLGLERPSLEVVDYEKKSKIVSILQPKWFDRACVSFTVIDIETTGLSKSNDEIVELAAIKYRNGVEVDKFVSLVKPKFGIPEDVIAIHHITNRMVLFSPRIEQVLPEFLAFLGDDLLVGHNVNFDVGFIEVASRRLGYDPEWKYVDTISVAKKLYPGLENYKQATVMNAIGYRQAVAHRAEEDCRGCAQILLNALRKGSIA